MADARRVLVLGGGFTAVHACRSMGRAIAAGRLDVTVVTRDNFLCAHGLIPEMVTGRLVPGTILNPARRIFGRARVHVGEIERIDLDARRVHTTRHLDGARFELEYDQALLAFGTAENLDAYPGLAEHAFKLKHFEDAFALRNHVVEMFELADIERDPDERRRLLTFFVAGGGFSGTEMAGELADLARLLTSREYRGIDRSECRVVIVHPGATLLPELYGSGSLERKSKAFPRLIEYGMQHARKLGVELMLETSVVGATPNEVYLSNGEHIPTRTIVSTVGTKPSRLLDGLGLERDERGRVRVDATLRVQGRDDLWAGGDCASVPHPKGGTCPPTARWAVVHGRRVGRNIARAAAGKTPRPFRTVVRTQGVSIGRRSGVAEASGIPIRGKLAWIGFRAVALAIIPSWDRRLRMLSDWLLWPLVGRDIVQMGRTQRGEYDVRHNVFQAGETIVEAARPVRYVHVVVEGEVEVVSGDRVTATVGPGGHFGRKWLEQHGGDAVRARSLVRTVALNAEHANRLQDVLLSTEPLVAKTMLTRIVKEPSA
jgi:NADH:ubiquinone reductase (H+-translocating)